MFARFFIDRPVFAWVISIVITLAGFVALFALPIAQYPEITPPTVEVSAVYPGANARVVADTVAAPIEQQVNGVEGMLYMSSQSTNDGAYSLSITFKPGVDMNFAQVLVQNRVNLALPSLPDVVKQAGVTTRKRSPAILLFVTLYSPDGRRVRIRDVGRVELAAKNQDISNHLDGIACSSLAIYQLPDANALDTADRIRAKMEELKPNLPDGVTYEIAYDTTPFIRES